MFGYTSGLKIQRALLTVCITWTAVGWAAQAQHPTPLAAKTRAILNQISPNNLKGDLSFLASDALQGRYTPSPGLEVAAEFIASQFRAAGLEPGGDQEYFQMAHMVDRKMPNREAHLKVNGLEVATDAWTIRNASAAVHLDKAAVVFFSTPDSEALGKSDLAGKVVMVQLTDRRKLAIFNEAVAESKAAAEIEIVPAGLPYSGSRLLTAEQAGKRLPALLLIEGKAIKASEVKSVTVDFPASEDRGATVKNVIGILRGSDARLKDTCVLLTAHYDHIGTTETGRGLSMPTKTPNPNDHIYNGANDDGSGTVSVIEIARALAKVYPRPKRSLVFMTFFGEERGELGSNFYGEHPVFPIAKTVADINLEQVGRTDSTNGKQVNTASLTGYDYSAVTKYLEQAGRETGIKVYKDAAASDAYFTRSDNDALAEQGVPAHSLTVAFDYPDYHGLGDEWPKVDYANMARVDRMVALGLLDIANAVREPQWNAQNPKTAPFREARAKSEKP